MEKAETVSQKLTRLIKQAEASGRTLTDGSSKIKAMGFVGGVRKPDNVPFDINEALPDVLPLHRTNGRRYTN